MSPQVIVNATCGHCEFFRNGCVPDGPEDVDAWCPSWEPKELDPDAEDEEEN